MLSQEIKVLDLDLKHVRGLIFDCDGVLFDSRDVNRHYYNHLRLSLGLEPMSEEEEDYAFMHTVDAALARIIPPELRSQVQAVQHQMSYNDFIERMIPEPGLWSLLSTLETLGIKMAINTNRKNSMELVLEHFDLVHYFDPVMTAAKVKNPKPDPEGLQVIVDHWGFSREQLAFLGDSSVDQESAHNAGVPFWAYKNSQLQAQLHVQSFVELRKCFQQGFCP